MSEKEKEEFLSGFPFWEHLSGDERAYLRGQVRKIHFGAGQPVFSGEANCLGGLFIEQGILRAFLLADDGRETTMFRLREGNVCMLAASCVLNAITFDVQIEAETECTLFLIPSPVLQRIVKQNIYMENYVYRMITERFADVITGMERMFFLNLPQRIAAFLLDESAAQGSDVLTLTQEQLAKAIGSAREAVSRSLKILVKGGFLEINRGTVSIVNKKGLYEML